MVTTLILNGKRYRLVPEEEYDRLVMGLGGPQGSLPPPDGAVGLPTPPPTRSIRFCRFMLPATWLVCAVATALDPLVAKWTALCGPLILLLGLVLLIGAIRAGSRLTLLQAAAHCGVCLLFYGLVVWRHWGPPDAQKPFFLMGLAYTALSGWLSWRARKALVPLAPWQCFRCGYALFGLSEPRCPECGEPFDPSRLQSYGSPPPQVLSAAIAQTSSEV